MVMIAAILFATSCKKDDDSPEKEDVGSVKNNGYRLVEINSSGYYGNGVTKFEYKDDKLVKTENSFKSKEGEDSETKREISYNGDEITVKNFKKESGEWKDGLSPWKITVKDNLITTMITSYNRYIYSDGEEKKVEATKTRNFTYEGKKLIKTESNEVAGADKTNTIIEYKYSGENVIEKLSTYTDDEWTFKNKEEIVYNGDKISEIVSYEYNEKEKKYEKSGYDTKYTYSGDNISKIERYRDQYNPEKNVMENKLSSYTNYEYDTNGNLVAKEYVYITYKGEERKTKTTYKYEKGDGNSYVLNNPETYLIYKNPIAQ